MAQRTAIIIVTYNGSTWITGCLASVFRSDADSFDVCVVDNHSSDDTLQKVSDEFPQVTVIPLTENRGFCGGNNIGIQRALDEGYERVVLLNQDTEVTPGWLSALIKASHDHAVGVVQSLLLMGDNPSLINSSGNVLQYLGFGYVGDLRRPLQSYHETEVHDIGYASGAAVLYTREVLLTVGLFDESYFAYHEDLDISWRARIAGYRVVVAPESKVLHYYSFQRNKNLLYWSERNRLMTILKNYQLGTLLILLPVGILIECMMLAYSLLSGFIHKKIWSYFFILFHIPSIMRSRARIRRFRTQSDRLVMRHMAVRLDFSEMCNPLIRYVVNPMLEFYYAASKHFIR